MRPSGLSKTPARREPLRYRREPLRYRRGAETGALEAKDEALRNQSLSLAFLSQQTAAAGDPEVAILLALEALPKDMAEPDRPHLIEAEAALYRALSEHRQTMVFRS